MIEAVLLDLDGTLADTAPDLAGAVNRMRSEEGFEPLPFVALRPYASAGVRGLLGAGFSITPEDASYADRAQRFLDYYAASICVHTRLFPGIAELLAALDARGTPWGVVTNKRSRFTHALLTALELDRRAACIVSGDSTPHLKPHPGSLLLAARQLGLSPSACAYIGDDPRDIEAGRAAGMTTVAAAYGYLGTGLPIAQWGADFVIQHPKEVLDIL